MALQLGADAETIHAYAGRQQTSLRTSAAAAHPSTLRLLTFDAVAGERLVRFLPKPRRYGSITPPRCWRGRAPGSAMSMFSRRPIRCCAER